MADRKPKLPITTDGKPRGRPPNKSDKKNKDKSSPMLDVKKLLAEREKFYSGLREVDKLKRNFDKLLDKEMKKEEKLLRNVPSASTSTATVNSERELPNVRPGREVFVKDKRYQRFSMDTLAKKKIEYEAPFQVLVMQLEDRTKLGFPELNESVSKVLFYIMSVDRRYIVCETCFQILESNVDVWIPKLKHIVSVLMNWGATCETLGLTDCEKLQIFGDAEPKKRLASKMDDVKEFRFFNFDKVISYLIVLMEDLDAYSVHEIYILVKLLIRVALHEEELFELGVIMKLISVSINSLADWDNFKVVAFSKYLYDESEHQHNLIAIATTIIPRRFNCADISSCLSFAILNALVNKEAKFNFPNEDDDLLQIVNTIESNPVHEDDLYRLYLIIYLINFIVVQRDIADKNKDVLKKLHESLEKLKMKVVNQHMNLDAELLKGRITYCSAMWTLLGTEERKEV